MVFEELHKINKKIIKNGLIRRFKKRMPISNFSFVMIYIIRKMLVLLKNHLNYLKDNIFKCSFKKCNKLLFLKELIFFIIYSDEKSKAQKRKHN